MSNPPFYYTPYYCEENAYHLACSAILDGRAPCMLFFFSPHCAIPLRHQKNAGPTETIYWDYHVMVYTAAEDAIYDLDCRLGMPLSRKRYLIACLRAEVNKQELYCRLVNKADVTKYFSSDRHHMLDANGQYEAPPPSWSPITQGPTFYPSWLQNESIAPGLVLSVKEFELSSAVDLRTRLKDRYTEV